MLKVIGHTWCQTECYIIHRSVFMCTHKHIILWQWTGWGLSFTTGLGKWSSTCRLNIRRYFRPCLDLLPTKMLVGTRSWRGSASNFGMRLTCTIFWWRLGKQFLVRGECRNDYGFALTRSCLGHRGRTIYRWRVHNWPLGPFHQSTSRRRS